MRNYTWHDCSKIYFIFKEHSGALNYTKLWKTKIALCVKLTTLMRPVWNKLLSSCYKVGDGNRLATICSNNTKGPFPLKKIFRKFCKMWLADTNFTVGEKFWSWKFSTFNNDIFWKFSVRGNFSSVEICVNTGCS